MKQYWVCRSPISVKLYHYPQCSCLGQAITVACYYMLSLWALKLILESVSRCVTNWWQFGLVGWCHLESMELKQDAYRCSVYPQWWSLDCLVSLIVYCYYVIFFFWDAFIGCCTVILHCYVNEIGQVSLEVFKLEWLTERLATCMKAWGISNAPS